MSDIWQVLGGILEGNVNLIQSFAILFGMGYSILFAFDILDFRKQNAVLRNC